MWGMGENPMPLYHAFGLTLGKTRRALEWDAATQIMGGFD